MSENTEFAYFAGRREGAKVERERIIKLIENETDYTCPDCGDRAIGDAIALIKGECEVDSNPTETETPCQCKKQP